MIIISSEANACKKKKSTRIKMAHSWTTLWSDWV